MVCQHNGQLLSEKAEMYEMDDASDSRESKNIFIQNFENKVNKKITKLSLK